ncbi:hypothetical protein WJ976_32245 (plasmid) [Achromobacter denitrificans]
MATSGGAAIMCADASADHGIVLPQAHPETQAVLDANVPEFGSARNPCDITGQVLNNPEAFRACASSLLRDNHYGALVLPQVTAGQAMADLRCPLVSSLASEAGKPVCIVWLSDWLEAPARQLTPAMHMSASSGTRTAAFAPWLPGKNGTSGVPAIRARHVARTWMRPLVRRHARYLANNRA